MRNRKIRFILLLVLLTTITLLMLPAALGDPPPADPTHMHSWVVTENSQPTCTQPGRKSWQCTSCGLTHTETQPALGHSPSQVGSIVATCTESGLTEGQSCSRCGAVLVPRQKINPLGHNWDEGVLTREPEGFTPGIITYTCKRNNSHTRTEEVDPLPYLFPWLQNGTFSPQTHDLPPLVITEQPEGGSIIRDSGSHTMHVTASGGTGNYTYAWHSSLQEVGLQEQNNAFLKWFVGLFGVPPEEVDAALDAPLSDTDTCTVTQGNCEYWCVVTDEAENTATSERAGVHYRIRIVQQPENANLQSNPSPMLSCEAADGSGSYSYTWIDNQDKEVDTGASVTVSEIGDYLCIVTDDVTGETVTSDACSVYSGEPFTLEYIDEDQERWPEEFGYSLTASFTGGVKPYEMWWEKEGMGIGSEDTETETTIWDGGPGDYTVHGMDAMGEKISGTVTLTERHLIITEQPQGGILPKDGSLPVRIAVEGGEPPYRFELYRNGELVLEETKEASSVSYAIWYPATVYFHVTDSQGHDAESNPARYEDPEFRIKSQTGSEVIMSFGGSAALSVEAVGGREPYTYQWLKEIRGRWYRTGGTDSTYSATSVGNYVCVVRDDAQKEIRTTSIPVTYTGGAPWILIHPSGGEMKKDASPPVLSCYAIAAEGHGIRYEWYRCTGEGRNTGWSRFAYDTQSVTAPWLGLYRCRAVDTETNGWAWSEIAVVSEELALEKVTEVAGSSDTKDYALSAKGGLAPYTVKVCWRWPFRADGKWEYGEVIYETLIFQSLESLNGYIFRIESDILAMNPFLDNVDPDVWGEGPIVYFIITDAQGNVCDSKE